MDTSRIRVEFIRFALLLIVTIALVSVATRINDDNGGSQTAGSRGTPTAAPSGEGSSTGGGSTSPDGSPTSTPGGSTTTPDGSPTGAPATGSGSGDGSTTDGSGSGTSASGDGASGDGSSVETLPRTGVEGPLKLAALAFLLLGAGTFSIRLSKR